MTGVHVLRTPEDRFAGLPDFGYPPSYADAGGLRIAYVQAGPADGEPVLLLHGEPSWSFLYRRVMAVLADAGLRAIAADLVGFGRSDKPVTPSPAAWRPYSSAPCRARRASSTR
jgi:haloalkane dehalogenase